MVTRQEAPSELELVRAFVNTLEVEGGEDELASAEALREWLTARGLLDGAMEASGADVENAVALREALRALLLANNGADPDPAAADTLDTAAVRARLSLRFFPDGRARHEPEAAGLDAALGRLLAIVAASMAKGTWPRLKACRSETCRWAFYDNARNRSRTWCDMAVCGNRVKARTYRKRRRAGS